MACPPVWRLSAFRKTVINLLPGQSAGKFAMNDTSRLYGIWSACLTPLRPDFSIDIPVLIEHVRWQLARGCHGVALFGTTGEGTSFSVGERKQALEAVLAAGVPASVIVAGSGCAALTDTIDLTGHAVKQGCAGVLTLPPFFFKGLGEEGLYRCFSELVERVGDAKLRVYLYNIPQLSAVKFPVKVIERLIRAYPTAIAGLKDSSGDWNSTKEYLDAFPGWGLFTGWDPHLREVVRLGGAGTISGMPNINMAGLRALYDNRTKPEGAALEATATTLIKLVDGAPPTAGLRAVLAHYTGKESWLIRRPPLEQNRDQETAIIAAVRATGFMLPPPLKPGE
jgi:4-hydroxy-tetrahydrodipicolinate synthase